MLKIFFTFSNRIAILVVRVGALLGAFHHLWVLQVVQLRHRVVEHLIHFDLGQAVREALSLGLILLVELDLGALGHRELAADLLLVVLLNEAVGDLLLLGILLLCEGHGRSLDGLDLVICRIFNSLALEDGLYLILVQCASLNGSKHLLGLELSCRLVLLATAQHVIVGLLLKVLVLALDLSHGQLEHCLVFLVFLSLDLRNGGTENATLMDLNSLD